MSDFDTLFVTYAPYIQMMSKRMATDFNTSLYPDFCQAGAIGLIDAIRRGNVDHPSSDSYIKKRIRGEIIDEFRKYINTSKSRRDALFLSVPLSNEAMQIADPFNFTWVDSVLMLDAFSNSLDQDLAYLVRQLCFDDTSKKEIAESIGCHPSWISTLIRRAKDQYLRLQDG